MLIGQSTGNAAEAILRYTKQVVKTITPQGCHVETTYLTARGKRQHHVEIVLSVPRPLFAADIRMA